MDLESYFAQIPDFRRAAGRRYPLSKLLLVITLAMMSGCQSYRELSRFIRSHVDELVQSIGWTRQQTPSHETLRTILSTVDFNQVNQSFMAWLSEHHPSREGDWVALDGKALRSTISDYASSEQNFINVVSAFNQRLSGVIASQAFEQKHDNEGNVVRSVIEDLKGVGLVLTMDALHCQKNTALNR